MKRGELYRVSLGSKTNSNLRRVSGGVYRSHLSDTDTKKQRVYVVVSRQELIDSAYSTLICAPVYTNYEGLSTQVPVGIEEGLKHPSAIRCDELISILKIRLTDYAGTLSEEKLFELGQALSIAVGIDN